VCRVGQELVAFRLLAVENGEGVLLVQDLDDLVLGGVLVLVTTEAV
jgi:hypothetical protein